MRLSTVGIELVGLLVEGVAEVEAVAEVADRGVVGGILDDEGSEAMVDILDWM